MASFEHLIHPGVPGPARMVSGTSAGPVWSIGEPGHERRYTPLACPATQRERMEEWAAALAEVREPHLVPIMGYTWRDDLLWIETAPVPGESLYDMLSDGSGLNQGQVATVLAPLGDALSTLHEAGLVHGAVSPPHVIVTAQGMPVLDGAWLHLDPPEPDRAIRGSYTTADVHSLARLGLWCLVDPGEHGELNAMLREIVGASGRFEISGRDLAAAALDVAEPQPLLPSTTPRQRTMPRKPDVSASGRRRLGRPGRGRSPSRGRRRTRRVVTVGLAALTVGAVGWLVAGRLAPGNMAGETAEPGEIVAELARARLAALGQCDEAELADLLVPGSAAAASEQSLLASLCHDGRRALGLAIDISEVEVVQRSEAGMRVAVTSALGGYRWVDSGGALVAEIPGEAPGVALLDLQFADGGWRLAAVGSPDAEES